MYMTSQTNNVFMKHAVGFMAVLVFGLIFNTFACFSVRAAIPQTGCYKRKGLDPKIGKVIENFRASVPTTVKKGKVSGVSIALVDEKGILWTEGFGTIGGKKKTRVTPDTPFSSAVCPKPLQLRR